MKEMGEERGVKIGESGLSHDEQMKLLGPERASMESPLASAVKLGVTTTIHCDCPSASPNIMEAIGTGDFQLVA
jgi:hypothetical protein